MLANVYTMCVSLEKSHQNDQQNGSHVEFHMRHKQKRNETEKKSESITTIADTNLLEVIQKEPKFFDEFECKYVTLILESRKQLFHHHHHQHHEWEKFSKYWP